MRYLDLDPIFLKSLNVQILSKKARVYRRNVNKYFRSKLMEFLAVAAFNLKFNINVG